jgi:enoyl-CoA hydratase/carnithine racemase
MIEALKDERPPAVIVEIDKRNDSLAIVRLNRPHERNPLSISTLGELDAAISALLSRSDLSALIITGTDDVFASGANIRELQTLTPETALDFARRGQRLFDKISKAKLKNSRVKLLTIAAINGYCMGGGLDLALACDLRCASREALFAHPGARLGIITGWGGTQRLPRLIGAARAFELFATARRMTSAEALEVGLVNRVGDVALDCALQLAQTISAKQKGRAR